MTPTSGPAYEMQGASLDLPRRHRVPVSWLKTYASAPVRWRIASDILSPSMTPDAERETLQAEVPASKEVTSTIRKQRPTGLWAGNVLGVAESKTLSIRGPGTVAQYRHLLELGLPPKHRPLRLAERVFFRLLSRDPDPKLLYEYQKDAKGHPAYEVWARDLLREGATAALAHAGHQEDPRVRGAAHRIISSVSHFLRAEASEEPQPEDDLRNAPEPKPPTIFSVAIVAYMPQLQRERAGFLERLVAFLSETQPKAARHIELDGKKVQRPFHLFGDPLILDSSGLPKDIPLALHWIELLARMGWLDAFPTAERALTRLLRDCDEAGVWNPKGLRAAPKSPSELASFAFPLEPGPLTPEGRKVDVTFRLALIAKLAGWELDFA